MTVQKLGFELSKRVKNTPLDDDVTFGFGSVNIWVFQFSNFFVQNTGQGMIFWQEGSNQIERGILNESHSIRIK